MAENRGRAQSEPGAEQWSRRTRDQVARGIRAAHETGGTEVDAEVDAQRRYDRAEGCARKRDVDQYGEHRPERNAEDLHSCPSVA